MRKSNCGVLGIALAGCALAGANAFAQLDDNFDSYAVGSGLSGQGGWSIWYSGGSDAAISDVHANSPGNSLRLLPGSDMIFEFSGITDGKWTYRAMTYMPSTSTGDAYLILMNGYGSGFDNWSMQIRFGGTDLVVESQWGLEATSLVTDQWVEFRAEIDLDDMLDLGFEVGSLDLFYNGVQFADDLIWIDNTSTGGTLNIANTDLYNDSCTEFFVDDISLLPGGCASDVNGDTISDILDFLDFLDSFGNCENQPAPCGTTVEADYNGDTIVDILDFLDFLDAFGTGC